ERLDQVQRLLEAADSFFRQKTIDLFAPECAARRADLDAVRRKKDQLGHDLVGAQEECRRLTNEVERAGGERLRQILFLIQNHEAQAKAKREASRRFHDALREAGMGEEVADAASFAAAQSRIPPLLR